MTRPCEWTLERLSAFADDELDPSERTSLEEHLAACESCARELGQIREADAIARAALPLPELPRGFVERLERRMALATEPAPRPRRALVPIAFAAGVLVGAAGVLAGLGLRAAPIVPAEDTALHRFIACSDVLMTDLTQLSGEDPERDLAILRDQARELELGGAIASVRERLPAIREADPALAQQVALAVDATDTVARRLDADSREPAELRFFEIRDDAERVELAPLVWSLGRGGLPRPPIARPGPTLAAPSEPRAAYLAGVRFYARGHLDQARACWERVLASGPERSIAVRAGYWAARSSVLDGHVEDAIRSLKSVAVYCPDAILETPMGPALRAELLAPGKLTLQRPLVVGTGGSFVVGEGGPGRVVFAPLLRDEPRELQDVVVHLVKTDADEPGPLIELRKIRIDDQDLLVGAGEDLASLKMLSPIMARRLGGQGRCEVHREDGGAVTIRFHLDQARFQSPEGRHFARLLSTAAGRPVADAKGNSRVSVVEVSGKMAP